MLNTFIDIETNILKKDICLNVYLQTLFCILKNVKIQVWPSEREEKGLFVLSL